MNFDKKYKGGRPRIEWRSSSVKVYKEFLEENPAIDLTFKEYDSIIRKLNTAYITYIIETGRIVKLPFGLGCLTISKRKPKKTFTDHNGTHINLPINWDETKKQEERVFHFNQNTDGYNCRWCWLKYNSKIKMMNIWGLKVCKSGKTLLSSTLKEKGKTCYQNYSEFNSVKKRRYKY